MRRLLSFLFTLLLLFSLILCLRTFENPETSGKRFSFSFKAQKAWAVEEAAEKGVEKETESEAEKTKEGEAKEKEAEEEHKGPPPLMYFVQWLILLTAFGLSLGYARKVRTHGRSHHEGIKLAYALTVLVLLYFGLNYYPTLAEYHEPGLASLLKLLLLLIAGALVTFYGVLGRHE